MSELLGLGVSHKTAPLELRERLALPEGRAVGILGELRDSEQINEAAALSTCNRTELYVVAAEPVEAESLVHPRVFATADGGLPPKMWLTLLVCFAGIGLLWVTLVRFELAAKSTSASLARLRRALDGDATARPGTAGRPTATVPVRATQS